MKTIKEIAQTKWGKVFLGLWLLMVIGVVTIGIIGLADHEVVGALVVSVLVAGVLSNICTILSYKVGAKSHTIARITWLILAMIALASVLILLNTGQKDADIALAYMMLVLTFPIGFIMGPIVSPMLSWDGNSSIVVYWGGCILVGYLQWFVVVPQVIAVMQNRKK